MLSLLVNYGYLVLDSKMDDPSKDIVKVPNMETRMVLDSLIKSSLSNYVPVKNTDTVR